MQVSFGTDGKRINSTRIPSVPTTINCVLKKPCTIENPVLDLSTFVPQYSVAYIPSFGSRYYFVNNIECLSNNIYRYHLSVDALASHKNKILANTVYVERSESHGTKRLVDPYATHTAANPNVYSRNYAISGFNSSGIYILQTAGKGTTTSIGQGVNTYLLTASELRKLINNIFTAGTYGTSVTDAEKTYFNPFQYIISCRWFPIDSGLVTVGAVAANVQFGWWNLTPSEVTAYSVKKETITINTDFLLPSLQDWTDTSPDYSRYSLQVPGIGSMEIDPAFCGMDLYACIEIDLLTGGAKCEIRQKSGDVYSHTLDPVLSVANGYWGVDVLLTQLATDTSNLASNVINSVSNAAYGMSFGETVSAANRSSSGGQFLSTSIGLLESIPLIGSWFQKGRENLLQPALSVNGAVGNFSEFNNHSELRLTIKHYNVLEADMADTNGLPYHRNVLLSTLSGYTRCNNASIPIAGATQQEKLAIKNMLEGGFWIE